MDRIELKDLEIYAYHGVMPEENVLGQKFLVSASMELDIAPAGKEDNLELSINYAKAAHFIKKYLEEHRFKLIETAAEQLAEQLLIRFSRINRLILKIKKPWAPILLPLDYVSVTIERAWHIVYLSIGSNMGDKEEHLKQAIASLEEDKLTKVTKQSSFLVTEPVGGVEQDDFLNAALEIKTLRTPEELLTLIEQIEESQNRVREVHWGPRTIDLDIIFYDDLIMQTEKLTIPHKEMLNRNFVLEPLAEIAPGMRHPYVGKTVYELWREMQ